MSSHKDKPTSVGMNRTGLGTAPIQSKEMLKVAQSFRPSAQDGTQMETVRIELARAAPPIGLMPPPSSIKGAVKSLMSAVQGAAPMVLLDKLGERLAFERTGVRLYQALLVKLEAADLKEGSPTREELEKIRDDELRHFALLERAIEQLGGDPTVVTPSADATAVSATGVLQLLGDSRSTLTECLSAMLMIELTDNDAWQMLANLAHGFGLDDFYREFMSALVEEEEHLSFVRGWVANAVFGQAGVVPPAPEARPPVG